MTRIERHPAPEKLIRQLTVEAVDAMDLGEAVDGETVSSLETGVALIAKAWNLPSETLQDSLDLIQREKELVRDGSGKSALPDRKTPDDYDGTMIAELLWGLFETAIRLEDAQERASIHEMALRIAEYMDYDNWIKNEL